MGTAVDERTAVERGASPFARSLTWRDGFWLAFAAPMAGLTIVGYEIGALGAYGAVAVWVGISVIALLQNHVFAELAGMYPTKSGIGLYSSDIWSRYFAPAGGVLAFVYWAGWSLTLSFGGLVIGDLIQGQWFPDATGTVSLFGNEIGLSTCIAAVVITVIYLVGISGIRLVVSTNVVLGIALIVVVGVCVIGPLVVRDVDTSLLTFDAGSGWWDVVVHLLTWGFFASSAAYGTEIAATFAPEYRDPKVDTIRALRRSALFVIVLLGSASVVFTGTIGRQTITEQPIGFFGPLMSRVVGRSMGGIAVAFVCAATMVAIVSATADSGRALCGMASDGITVRQLGKLNRAGQPARAMTVDLVFNLVVLLLVSDVSGIVFAGNFGYLLAIVFALAGFVLLRRTHPHVERPFRLGRIWVPIACCLIVLNVLIIAMAFSHPELIGYGASNARLVAVGVVVLGFVSYFFSRVVQHRVHGRALWRSESSTLDESGRAPPPRPSHGRR
jgi:amino acid transporter